MEDQKMQLVDWLDDLCVRFIINLPQEELESVERICFQIEEAQWFYEDFIRPLDPSLPSLQLRTFALQMFQHCPLFANFHESQYVQAFDQFLAYKTRVPVRGAIILNDAMDQVLLVKGWKKGANWSFPRGKINKDERDLDCAVREAYEEIGYDLNEAGLVHDESQMKFIEVTMREQHMKLYVFRGVPMDTPFAPRTRKEISKISWYKLASLPGWQKKKQQAQKEEESTLSASKMYMVAPFLHPLKGWITQQRKLENHIGRKTSTIAHPVVVNLEGDDYITDDRNAHNQIPPPDLLQPGQEYDQIDGTAQHLSSLNDDPAAGLKRLLSVGQPAHAMPQQNIAPAPNSNATDLLAMLQSSRNGNSYPVEQSNMQSARFEEAGSKFQRPHGHQHQHLGQTNFGTAQYPQHSSSAYAPRHPPQHSFANVFHSQAPQTMQQMMAPPEARQQLHSQPSLLGLLNQPASQAQSSQAGSQAPAPYHRIGDPQFARGPQAEAQHTSIVPPASDLSAPKLSAHAQSLLNVFKSGNTSVRRGEAVHSPVSRNQLFPSHAARNDPQHRPNTINELQHNQHRNEFLPIESRKPPADSMRAPQFAQPSQITNPGFSNTQPPPSRNSNSQQNALLDLFRKPSAPPATYATVASSGQSTLADLLGKPSLGVDSTQSSCAPTLPSDTLSSPRQQSKVSPTPALAQGASPVGKKNTISNLAPEPVELSAKPSPGPGKKQIFDHRDGKLKEHVTSPRMPHRSHDLARPVSGLEKPLTSATVTGPVQEPDFWATKRRAGQNKSESTPKKSEVSSAPQHSTVKILRRPETPKQAVLPEPKVSPRPVPSPKPDQSLRATASPMHKRDNRQNASPRPMAWPHRSPAQVAPPKPFTPQILRRPPQPVSEAAVAEMTAMTPKESRDTVEVSPEAKTELSVPPPAPKPDLLSLFRTPSVPLPAMTSSVNAIPQPEDIGSNAKSQAATTPAASHTRDLLSLFAKPSAPASATKPTQADLSSLTLAQSTKQISTPLTRSRFNSIASRDRTSTPLMSPISQNSGAATATQSRRGSQTPISPSDRGFLLNYLDGFTKGVGQKK